ncbi:unnamed protein product [Haemonchus placei]|uniref:Uncharacterized protein n=1 Tax=Haemonchus placei TaxID=6290 RepID=A0A0N4VZU9_HAEPC|nr:unnamed protein product [Haemonchus placei]
MSKARTHLLLGRSTRNLWLCLEQASARVSLQETQQLHRLPTSSLKM